MSRRAPHGHDTLRFRSGVVGWLVGAAMAAAGCAESQEPITAPNGGRAVPARSDLAVGLNFDFQSGDKQSRANGARLVRRSGATIARDDFQWSIIEPRRGQYDWSQPDAIVAAAAGGGLRTLPILGGTPAWAGPDENAMPTDPADYARFATRVVERYGPGGVFWREHPKLDPALAIEWFELYNEPYLQPTNPDGPDPAAYARTVRAAVPAARAANPRARFLLAADTTGVNREGRETPWLTALYDAVPDLGRYFDGVAVHPYADEQSPTRYRSGGRERWQTPRIEEMRETLVDRGEARKPMWITEIGWSTCDGGEECVDERRQARNLAETFDLASNRWRYVEAVLVYTLGDFPAPPKAKEGSFGILRSDLTPKPSWGVLQTAGRAPPSKP